MGNAMRFVTDLSKGILGEADSPELWAEIISHIPDAVLLKPNVKILNVSCGHGTEADLLVKRMRALGISAQDVNDSIYLLDKYHVFTNRAAHKGYKNVITADFLEWETDMKFDVVIGNPPYQDAHRSGNPLWPLFIKKSFELVADSGYVGLITPGRWVLPGHNIKESKIRIWDQYVSKFNPILINLGECSRHFKVGASEDYFSYFLIQASSTKGLTSVTTTEDKFSINLDNVSWLPYRNCTLTSINILSKVSSKNYKPFSLVWKYDRTHTNITDSKTSTNSVPIFFGKNTIKYSDHQSELHNSPKILFKLGRFIPYQDRVYIDNTGNISYNSAYVANIDHREDVSYLLSKLYIFIASCLFNGSEITAEGYRTLPRLPSGTWTDQELYAHFGLTQEEIDYVEANVK